MSPYKKATVSQPAVTEICAAAYPRWQLLVAGTVPGLGLTGPLAQWPDLPELLPGRFGSTDPAAWEPESFWSVTQLIRYGALLVDAANPGQRGLQLGAAARQGTRCGDDRGGDRCGGCGPVGDFVIGFQRQTGSIARSLPRSTRSPENCPDPKPRIRDGTKRIRIKSRPIQRVSVLSTP